MADISLQRTSNCDEMVDPEKIRESIERLSSAIERINSGEFVAIAFWCGGDSFHKSKSRCLVIDSPPLLVRCLNLFVLENLYDSFHMLSSSGLLEFVDVMKKKLIV